MSCSILPPAVFTFTQHKTFDSCAAVFMFTFIQMDSLSIMCNITTVWNTSSLSSSEEMSRAECFTALEWTTVWKPFLTVPLPFSKVVYVNTFHCYATAGWNYQSTHGLNSHYLLLIISLTFHDRVESKSGQMKCFWPHA